MANNLHQREPKTKHVRLLHQPKVPRILQPLFQSRPECQSMYVAGKGHSECIRAQRDQVSRYEEFEKWV
ncbi:hypothetical protein K470DRAFT_40954 [Piedraia hortae CBS 480.64]|uniref:Uncharacterized protein n=1 Tax=Piedraia hortae CBS 480.64 TaxID=1314780 RepID=A0A6A7C2U2_9PEZI|nr:hypothetical protein K470DRAFT_40954 [Piedraia hortae CBS 480.64]